ncbi:MAG TPA: hypothetical protein PK743_01605 [Luteimonas sp.]|nr:hypothetical protein [Luteimonas sp.]HRP71315.1 hypothetical protein [Luteimonas sp.]
MFEGLAVLVVVLAAVVLVYFKARERLASPGAKRSRRDGDGNSGNSGSSGRDRNHGGDGADGDGGGGSD